MASREPIVTRSRSATRTRGSSPSPELPPPAPTAASTPIDIPQAPTRFTRTRAAQMYTDVARAAAPAAAPKPLRRAAAGRRLAGRPPKRIRRDTQLTGLFDKLPLDLLEIILQCCGPKQLGRLNTTCSYFKTVKKVDGICQERLKAIPRAKGMVPNGGCVCVHRGDWVGADDLVDGGQGGLTDAADRAALLRHSDGCS